MTQIQNWMRIHQYERDYFNLIYRYYSAHATAYICTYYHLDIPNSCLDTTVLDAGAYERIGNLTGLVWEKITLFPIYNTSTINSNFLADERGFGKFDQQTEFNFPSVYGITPTTLDLVYFEVLILNENQQTQNKSLYHITNFEKSTNTDFTFWKVLLKIDDDKKDQLELQLNKNLTFVDYEKTIYTINKSINLYTQLQKNANLNLNEYYLKNIGYYTGF